MNIFITKRKILTFIFGLKTITTVPTFHHVGKIDVPTCVNI